MGSCFNRHLAQQIIVVMLLQLSTPAQENMLSPLLPSHGVDFEMLR
jgi:hypothetical protein